MPSVSQTKQEIATTLKHILKTQGEFEIDKTAAHYALQTGFKIQTIRDIIEYLRLSGIITIDKYGVAKPVNSLEVQDGGE